MVETFLYIFSFVSILFVLILLLQKHDYKQFHWLFIMLMIMYNLFTGLNFLDIKPSFVRINMDLTYNEHFIELQLLISTFCILAYLILLLIFKNKFVMEKNYILNDFSINLNFLYLFLYPLTLILVIYYPWPEHGDTISFGNSLAAYAKNIQLVLMVMIFVYYPKSKKGLLLISYIILILIDTQRTPLLVAFIAYLLLSENGKALKYTSIGISGILILSIIAIYRNGVSISLVNMLYPFYNEGIFGSYCALQSLAIVENYDYNIFTNLMLIISPINDILLKLIPNVYFEVFNSNKEDFYLFGKFIGENIQLGNITEAWTPMGGFFYIAESNLMIPYIGPVIFTVLLFFLIRKINLMKNPALKVLLYSNLFLCIKANLFIVIKYMIFLLIAYYSIIFIDKFFKAIHLNSKRSKLETIN